MKTLEAKKPQPITSTKAEDSTAASGKVMDFFADVKAELKKINWTSPDELRTYTKIVVGMTLCLGLGIYAMDLIIQTFLNGLSTLIHWIS